MLIGATTENPFFSVNSPLLSRATLWRLEPLDDDDIAEVIAARPRGRGGRRPTTRPWRPWCRWPTGTPGPPSGPSRWPWPWPATEPDHRRRGGAGPGRPPAAPGRRRPLRPVSALIKSIRGSDPDAGLYWFARMLEGGEDARFIARRLVILASEDVGLADPWPWWWPTPPPGPWSSWGCPRPSSTWPRPSSTWRARPSRTGSPPRWAGPGPTPATGPRADVPTHLRDAHYRGAAELGPRRGLPLPPRRPPGLGGTGLPSSRRWPATSTTSRATTAPRRRSASACAGAVAPVDDHRTEKTEPLTLIRAGHRRRIAGACSACLAVSGSVVAAHRRWRGAPPPVAAAGARRGLGAQHRERARAARGEPRPAARCRRPTAVHGRRRAQAARPRRPRGLRHRGVHAGVAVVPSLPRPRRLRARRSGRSPATIAVGAGLADGPGPRRRPDVARRPHRPGVGHGRPGRPGLRRRARAVPAAVGARSCASPTPSRWCPSALAGALDGVAGLDDLDRPVPQLASGPPRLAPPAPRPLDAGAGPRAARRRDPPPTRGLLQRPSSPIAASARRRSPSTSWPRRTRSRASTPAATRVRA